MWFSVVPPNTYFSLYLLYFINRGYTLVFEEPCIMDSSKAMIIPMFHRSRHVTSLQPVIFDQNEKYRRFREETRLKGTSIVITFLLLENN